MQFSVIYTVDAKPGGIKDWMIPKGKEWKETEREMFDSTSDETGDDDYDHVKVCALLSKAQFVEFVKEMDLTFEDCLTMGMIGGPGFGLGWAPAHSFNGSYPDYYDGQDAWSNAYVCPIPSGDPEGMTDEQMERNWERIRIALRNMFR